MKKIKRFFISDWWCSTNPFSRGGLWWQHVIDRETGKEYYVNRRNKTFREWIVGDDKNRDDYIELHDVKNYHKPIVIPKPRFSEKQKFAYEIWQRNQHWDDKKCWYCANWILSINALFSVLKCTQVKTSSTDIFLALEPYEKECNTIEEFLDSSV